MLPRHQPNIGRHPPDRLKSCCRRLACSVYRLSKTIAKRSREPLPNLGGILSPPEQDIRLSSKDSNRKPKPRQMPQTQGGQKKKDKLFTFKAPPRTTTTKRQTSKEQYRASLEGYVPDKRILSDNLKAAKSALTDLDFVLEMTEFVNDHLLTQPGVVKLIQKRISLPLAGMALVYQN